MPETTVRPARVSSQEPALVNESGAGRVPASPVGGGVLGDRPALPELWPVMSEDDARLVLVREMRVCAGVPVNWWGEDQEILVATHDPGLAVRAADELARLDRRRGYLGLVQAAVTVVGPINAVPVGWLHTDHVDWVCAGPDAEYAVSLCVVRPAYPVRPDARPGAAVVDVAAEAVERLREADGGEPR